MRCLALDLGERRIGVSVGELLARPLTTVKRSSKERDFAAIAALVREQQVDTLVVGLPLNMDGSVGSQAEWTMRYARQLRDALAEMGLNVDLVLWDERMTTEQAEEAMIAGGHRRRDLRSRVDAVAAAAILQSFLNRQQVEAQGGPVGMET